MIDQLRSISEWIGIGVGFLLAGLLIISPFILGAIAYNLVHKFLVSKRRPDYVGPQFENDLVSFSKNTKSGLGGHSYSDELTYTFACDSYGEKFREINSQIVKTAWYESA